MNDLRGIVLRMLLALSLSVMLWVVVWIQEGGRQTYRSVSVNAERLAPDLVIVDEDGITRSNTNLAAVSVVVESDAQTLSTLDQSDLNAFVDLHDINTPGNHTVPIQVRTDVQNLSFPDNFPQIDPSSLAIRLEQWITRTVPLTVEVLGKPPFSYESGPAEVLTRRSPNRPGGQVIQSVQVAGPQNRVNQVQVAFAAVNIDQMRTTSQSTVQLESRDANNNPVEGVQLSPEQVMVRVPIGSVVGLRRVPVLGTILGVPAPGHVITGVDTDPAIITLSGNSTSLNQVNEVTTAPVDIGGATDPITRVVPLLIPLNTQSHEGVTQARIIINIRPQTDIFTSTLYFRVIVSGAENGMVVSHTPLFIPVSVTGIAQELEQLGTNTPDAFINVSGLDPGTHQLTPMIPVSGAVTVTGEIEPVNVSITWPSPLSPPESVPPPTPPIPIPPIPTEEPRPTEPPHGPPPEPPTILPEAEEPTPMPTPTDFPEPTEEPLPTEEPPLPTKEPLPPTEEPLPPTEEPPLPTEEPLPPTEEPLPPTEEPPLPTEEPLPPTEEPPLPTEEPPESLDSTPFPLPTDPPDDVSDPHQVLTSQRSV